MVSFAAGHDALDVVVSRAGPVDVVAEGLVEVVLPLSLLVSLLPVSLLLVL